MQPLRRIALSDVRQYQHCRLHHGGGIGQIFSRFLALLIFSMTANFLIGQRLTRPGSSDRLWLALGVTLNLFVLGVFKYANFFIANLNAE